MQVSRFFPPMPLRRYALALGLAALAALPPPSAVAEEAPITIEAERMLSQENKNSVVFQGNVVAKQGAMTIRTDKMTVFYSDSADGNKAAGQLEKLVCLNNVRITQDDWLGTGNRLDYYAKGRKAVLSGNAQAWNGPSMVAGRTITYYLNEKRSVVEPGGQPGARKGKVRAVLRPGSK